jgi:hypothetical protein
MGNRQSFKISSLGFKGDRHTFKIAPSGYMGDRQAFKIFSLGAFLGYFDDFLKIGGKLF